VNAGGATVVDQVVFWVLAVLTTFFAGFTITRRNPVTAVMSLVATFFCLAGIYASLSAHFLAVIQVLVYAGAIMVLFIFVIMILNREEVAPFSFRPLRILGVMAGVYLLIKLVDVVTVGIPEAAPGVAPASLISMRTAPSNLEKKRSSTAFQLLLNPVTLVRIDTCALPVTSGCIRTSNSPDPTTPTCALLVTRRVAEG